MKLNADEVRELFSQMEDVRDELSNKLDRARVSHDYMSLDVKGDWLTFTDDWDGEDYQLPLELVVTGTADDIREFMRRKAEEKKAAQLAEREKWLAGIREEELERARAVLREAGEL